jgi:integrating conjugative element membrane protein (TIGR03747 family)
MAARAPVVQRELRRPALTTRAIRGALRILSMLVLALCCSILLEWLGMFFWWPEQGVRHSEQMLAQELRYLNQGFERSIVVTEPLRLGQAAADRFDEAFAYIGIYRLIAWLRSPEPLSDGWQALIHEALRSVRIYVEAMTNTAKVFAVRFTVLALATPVFVLLGLVGFAEGLMRRDLRRWGGGRESSFLYHHTKKLLGPSIVTAWMLYLAAPFSIHPNWVLLPFAALFAVGVAMTTGTFKKYL